MYHPQYSMFFDMHTQQACPEVGRFFDPEAFAEKLKNTGVDLCGFHAKCNQGFCYFNTQKGIRHPSLAPEFDLFGDVVKACARRNIKVSAYFNCGLSNEDAVRHPDWARIGMEGNIYHPEIGDLGWTTPYIRTMCPNSPWRDHLLNLIREVKEQYDVAGFLFDSFNVFPCICPHCTAGMKAEGLDFTKEEDVLAFAKKSVERLAEDISALLEPQKNGLLAYFLGLGSQGNLRLGSYLECECLPNHPAWGYDYLPLYARYFRNLDEGKRPVLNMTGRFNAWADFGSLRTAPAIEYDVFFGLANGMRPNIGDHLHPAGHLFDSVFGRVEQVYSKAKQYDPWYQDARNLTDLAVVIPGYMSKTPELVGLTRMLSELKIQFDFINASCDWSRYDLLILPDSVILNDELAPLVRAHLAAGKKIIATGRSGLAPGEEKFLFEEAWGCRYKGKCDADPAYFKLTGEYAKALPDMPLFTVVKGEEVEALPGAAVAGKVITSYFNKGWDGKYSVFYAPPARETDLPFLILNDQCAYCPFPLCTAYFEQTSPDLRTVLEIMLKHFKKDFLVQTSRHLPSFGRAFVSEKENMRMVHLLNYQPDLRGKNLMVEEPLALTGTRVVLAAGGRKVKEVYLAPGKTPLAFTEEGDTVAFTLPESYGYAMAVAVFA